MSFGSFEHMLWWVFVGSRGGRTRVMMMELLIGSPMNAHQLATKLEVNYRTVSHHLRVLTEHKLVQAEGPRYGQVFFPTAIFTSNVGAYRAMINDKKTETHTGGVS